MSYWCHAFGMAPSFFEGSMRMRVYYNSTDYIDFKTADHWESIGSDWCELYDESDNLLAILNWNHVWLIKMLEPTDS